MSFFVLAFPTILISLVGAQKVLKTNAWQNTDDLVSHVDTFPELKLESVTSRPSAAIAFSGGGTLTIYISFLSEV
jgi:hypothetical protein